MTSESPKCDCSCSCENSYNNHSSSPLLPPFKVTTSEFTISLKEIIILSMILFLLLYSIFAFLKHWKRNYYDISTSCQFNSQINDSGEPNLIFPSYFSVPRRDRAPSLGGG